MTSNYCPGCWHAKCSVLRAIQRYVTTCSRQSSSARQAPNLQKLSLKARTTIIIIVIMNVINILKMACAVRANVSAIWLQMISAFNFMLAEIQLQTKRERSAYLCCLSLLLMGPQERLLPPMTLASPSLETRLVSIAAAAPCGSLVAFENLMNMIAGLSSAAAPCSTASCLEGNLWLFQDLLGSLEIRHVTLKPSLNLQNGLHWNLQLLEGR